MPIKNYHPSSRFVPLERPKVFPHRDIIDGDTSQPVFDLGVDVDARVTHGVAYLRIAHVEEMAHVLGMSTREETEQYKARIKELEAQVQRLPKKVEDLKNALDECISYFHHDLVSPDSDSGDSAPSEVRKVLGIDDEEESGKQPESPNDPDGIDGQESESASGESGSDKKASGQKRSSAGNKGTASVSSSASNDGEPIFGFGKLGS